MTWDRYQSLPVRTRWLMHEELFDLVAPPKKNGEEPDDPDQEGGLPPRRMDR